MKGQCFFLYSGFLQFFITLRYICLYLLLFVGGFMSYLHYLCVCVYIVVCFFGFVFLLCLVYPMLPVSLVCPFVLLSFWCSLFIEKGQWFFFCTKFSSHSKTVSHDRTVIVLTVELNTLNKI